MGNIFEERLKSLGISRQVSAAVVVANAQKVINDKFGQRGSDNIQVTSFSKGVLKIATSSGAWSAECRKVEGTILAELKQVNRIYYTHFSTNIE